MAKRAGPATGREIGRIAHTELASADAKATSEFLGSVFGWKFQKVKTPSGEIFSFNASGGLQGSVRQTRPNETPVSINYVLVDSLAAAERKVRKAGAEIVLPRVDVPEMGSFFWFRVPGGPILACWEDAPERRSKQDSRL